MAAGDENLHAFLQGQSLLSDNGDHNWALINDMSNRPRAPAGMRMALITMGFLMARRNYAVNAMRRLRLLIDDLTQQLVDARNHLLQAHQEGLQGEPLRQLQDVYIDMRTRLVALEADLQDLQTETPQHQADVQEAQRLLVTMFYGYVAFAPLINVNRHTRRGMVAVRPIPWPYDEVEMRGGHWAVRFPATSMVVIWCLIGTPLMLLHPVNQNTPDRPDVWEQRAAFALLGVSTMLLFANLYDFLFSRRR
ncbi:MAG: hypothetical protein DCF26_06650 [Burkholderiales bacterium]|nr:MAG: hypothetical protein DCF26_06650 [Burkholderiales bacterium]